MPVTNTEYWTNALVYSALGFIVGVIVGLGVRSRFKIKLLDRRARERLLGAILIFIALVSQAQSLWFQRHQRDVTSCQVRYNERFNSTLQERTDIANRDRKNINDMIAGVMALTPGDRERGRQILQTYLDNNKKLDTERRDSRYPRPASQTCK